MDNIILFTIGYTKKSARDFFSILKNAQIRTLLDIRLNNTSQLAGFTKMTDLEYFLEIICFSSYKHIPSFAPTKEILDFYHSKVINWNEYEIKFKELLNTRKPENAIDFKMLDHACLLCAEPTAEKCHRRLVAEYLRNIYPALTIKHL